MDPNMLMQIQYGMAFPMMDYSQNMGMNPSSFNLNPNVYPSDPYSFYPRTFPNQNN